MAKAFIVRDDKTCHVSYTQAERYLTHCGRDKMAAIFQTTFSNAFSSMQMCEFRLRFHWNLFLRVKSTIFQHCLKWWLGADQATCHQLNQWWLVHWRTYVSLGLNELKRNTDWTHWPLFVRWSLDINSIFFKCLRRIDIWLISSAIALRRMKHTESYSWLVTIGSSNGLAPECWPRYRRNIWKQ